MRSWLTGVCLLLLLVTITVTEVLATVQPLWKLHRDLRKLLQRFDRTCCALNVRYWICSGTLLGAVREGDIIAHDDDADVAVPEEDLALLETGVQQHGLKIARFLPGIYRATAEGLSGFVDIFPVVREADFYVFTGWARTCWPREKFSVHAKFDAEYTLGRLELEPQLFAALQLRGPEKTEALQYVARAYGADWTTPRAYVFHTPAGFRGTYAYPLTLGVLSALALVGVLLPSRTLCTGPCLAHCCTL